MSQLQNISLFIPHVFLNFDKEYVAYAFEYVGEIERIDFVLKVDVVGKQYNAVYVHFSRWFDNSNSTRLHSDIMTNGSAKFYHDDKWYWIVLQNTGKKNIAGERRPRIELGENNVVNKCSSCEVDFEYADMMNDAEEEKLDEIERVMDEEDTNIVCIDSRYVQSVEEENLYLRSEVFQLREVLIKMDQMYQAEAAKVRTLTTDI